MSAAASATQPFWRLPVATAEQGPLSTAMRLYLMAELAVIFLAAPIGVHVAIHYGGLPLFVVLWPILIVVCLLLWSDRTFSFARLLSRGFGWRHLAAIVALFLVAGALIVWGTQRYMPESFLGLPNRAPRLWLLIMVLYPLISVITQELIYRVFFFHRYGRLFGEARWMAILVNGVLFSFGHIMFQNWVAIIACLFGGLLFAWRYQRTGSIWAVMLEHTLYGNLIFTVGLGRYFFTGVSNISW